MTTATTTSTTIDKDPIEIVYQKKYNNLYIQILRYKSSDNDGKKHEFSISNEGGEEKREEVAVEVSRRNGDRDREKRW